MTTTTDTTLISAAGTRNSMDRHGCPGVHRVDDHTEHYVITREVSDRAVLDRLAPHVNPGEHVGSVPAWVPCGLMDLPTLSAFIDDHVHTGGHDLFRMETLPLYDVATDPSWARWQAGLGPDWDAKQSWLDELADHASRGIGHRRVRRFGPVLSEHEIYECTWGYELNGPAGEDIRVLRDGEHDVPDGLVDVDYWVVNHEVAVPVLYDARGRFVGAGWLDGRAVGAVHRRPGSRVGGRRAVCAVVGSAPRAAPS